MKIRNASCYFRAGKKNNFYNILFKLCLLPVFCTKNESAVFSHALQKFSHPLISDLKFE